MFRSATIIKRILLLMVLFTAGYGWHMVLHYTVPLWARFPLVLLGDTTLLTAYWFFVGPQALLRESLAVGGVLVVLATILAVVKTRWYGYVPTYKTVYSCIVAGVAPYIAGRLYLVVKRGRQTARSFPTGN